MSRPAPASRRIQLALVLTVTVGCLAWVLWGINTDKALDALANARWWLLGPAVGTYLLTHFVRTWRYAVLVGAEVPLRRVFSVCAIGFLAINVVPFRLGEFVRPYLLTRDGVPVGQALGGVVLERLLDMAMLLGLLVLVAFGLDLPAESVRVGGVDVVVAGQRGAAAVLVVGALGLTGLVLGGAPAIELLRRLPVLGPSVASLVTGLVGSATELARRPARGVLAVALSIITWALTVVGVWIVLQAFSDLPGTWSVAIVVWTVTIAGMAALPTPGFFGPYEAFCSAALLLWQVDPSVASTFAVVLHLSHFGFTVALGLPFLVSEGRGLTELVRESRAP
ncbi:MAG: uncharacterized membrane protein YbhN (UPF0104 family) [Myxococcota bacterium]|jgi:uncharacterized membrane protein YbhN (UPF0104 family)